MWSLIKKEESIKALTITIYKIQNENDLKTLTEMFLGTFPTSVFTWLTKPVWLTGFLKKNGFGYLNLNNRLTGFHIFPII